MNPVANRVNASVPLRTVASTSASAARRRTRSTTWSASSSGVTRLVVRSVVVIASPSDADADPAEPGRDRGVPRVTDLDRLALAAVRCAPERPLVAAPEHVHRAPEPRADRRVRRILEHPRLL